MNFKILYMGISINMGTRSNCVMSNHEISLSGYMKIHLGNSKRCGMTFTDKNQPLNYYKTQGYHFITFIGNDLWHSKIYLAEKTELRLFVH